MDETTHQPTPLPPHPTDAPGIPDTRRTNRWVVALLMVAVGLSALVGGAAFGAATSDADAASSTPVDDSVASTEVHDPAPDTPATPAPQAPADHQPVPEPEPQPEPDPAPEDDPEDDADGIVVVTIFPGLLTPSLEVPEVVSFGPLLLGPVTLTNTGLVPVEWSPGPSDAGVVFHSPGGSIPAGESTVVMISVAPSNGAWSKSASIHYGGENHPFTVTGIHLPKG
jgi:hypothetical protein